MYGIIGMAYPRDIRQVGIFNFNIFMIQIVLSYSLVHADDVMEELFWGFYRFIYCGFHIHTFVDYEGENRILESLKE